MGLIYDCIASKDSPPHAQNNMFTAALIFYPYIDDHATRNISPLPLSVTHVFFNLLDLNCPYMLPLLYRAGRSLLVDENWAHYQLSTH